MNVLSSLPLQLDLLTPSYVISKVSKSMVLNDSVRDQILAIINEPKSYSFVHDRGLILENPISQEKGWRALCVRGTLEFSLSGILLQILIPLGAADISVLTYSSYDTDYILVQDFYLERAVKYLRSAGIEVHDLEDCS